MKMIHYIPTGQQNTNTGPGRKTPQTSAITQNNSPIGEHHQNILAEWNT
jgi:hypothetical protein